MLKQTSNLCLQYYATRQCGTIANKLTFSPVLSKMAKLVRWLHSQTEKEELDNVELRIQPLDDQILQ